MPDPAATIAHLAPGIVHPCSPIAGLRTSMAALEPGMGHLLAKSAHPRSAIGRLEDEIANPVSRSPDPTAGTRHPLARIDPAQLGMADRRAGLSREPRSSDRAVGEIQAEAKIRAESRVQTMVTARPL
jgi:hypothetical protein